MRSIFVLLGAVCVSVVCAKPKASKCEQFWGWFSKNQTKIYDFESNQNEIFDSISKEMKKIDSNLTFEFGPKENGKREFVLSADGIVTSFAAVESLFVARPTLKQWTIIKFRPRRGANLDFELGNMKISQKDIKFALKPDTDPLKITISMYINGYNKAERSQYRQACYLILDGLIGEYDMETKVGAIGVYGFDSPNIKWASDITGLPSAFDGAYKEHIAPKLK